MRQRESLQEFEPHCRAMPGATAILGSPGNASTEDTRESFLCCFDLGAASDGRYNVV